MRPTSRSLIIKEIRVQTEYLSQSYTYMENSSWECDVCCTSKRAIQNHAKVPSAEYKQ